MLLSSGHDLQHLMDRYTMRQVSIMAQAVWQHRLTTLSVIAYAVGGGEAQERADDVRGGERPQRVDPSAWEGKEWRLESPPTITPEEDERRKLKAISALMGVQQAQMEMAGMRGAPSVTTIQTALPDAFAAQLADVGQLKE